MSSLVQARLDIEDRKMLAQLKRATKQNISNLVREGLRLLYREKITKPQSAYDLVKDYAGKYKGSSSDLSYNKKHLEGFGR